MLTIIRPLVVRYCRARLGRAGPVVGLGGRRRAGGVLGRADGLARVPRPGTPFLAFVYGIASHKVIDAHRASSRNRSEPVADVPDAVEVGGRSRAARAARRAVRRDGPAARQACPTSSVRSSCCAWWSACRPRRRRRRWARHRVRCGWPSTGRWPGSARSMPEEEWSECLTTANGDPPGPPNPFGGGRRGTNGVRPDGVRRRTVDLPTRPLPVDVADGPIDLVAVQADDELVNALGSGAAVSVTAPRVRPDLRRPTSASSRCWPPGGPRSTPSRSPSWSTSTPPWRPWSPDEGRRSRNAAQAGRPAAPPGSAGRRRGHHRG